MALKVGTGYSDDLDEPHDAGKTAAQMAVSKLDGAPPKLILVFACIEFEHEELLAGIRSVTGDTPLVGGTTDGEMSDAKGVTDDSVVVMAFAGDDVLFSTGLGEGADKDHRAAGRSAAAAVPDCNATRPKILICLPDVGLTGGGVAVIEGMQEVLGRDFPIVGGAPADGQKLKGTYQYYHDRVYQNAVVTAYLEGALRFGSGVQSGLKPLGKKAVCTKSQGSMVLEIDQKPAIEHHRAYVGSSLTVPTTISNFPYIILDESGGIDTDKYYVARTSFFYDEKTGALARAAPIPEGSYIKIARSAREDILQGTHNAVAQARAMYGAGQPAAVLIFSCSGRKQVLGLDLNQELAIIRDEFGHGVPTIGFFSYGEFGPMAMDMAGGLKQCSYHSYTASILAIGA